MEGVQAYAKCSSCGSICWTEESVDDQSVSCVCGQLKIINASVTGPTDETYTAATVEQLIADEGN